LNLDQLLKEDMWGRTN